MQHIKIWILRNENHVYKLLFQLKLILDEITAVHVFQIPVFVVHRKYAFDFIHRPKNILSSSEFIWKNFQLGVPCIVWWCRVEQRLEPRFWGQTCITTSNTRLRSHQKSNSTAFYPVKNCEAESYKYDTLNRPLMDERFKSSPEYDHNERWRRRTSWNNVYTYRRREACPLPPTDRRLVDGHLDEWDNFYLKN